MSNNVISFSQKQNEATVKKEFINILDKDIATGNIEEIPNSVFERIANIKHKALLARKQNELQEM